MAKKSNLFGRADASLVAAAYREGMSRGPGDLSGPLKEQLTTNNMMWEMIEKEFNKAFGDTIARDEEFKEATDKVMAEFQGGTAYDESMMQMYDTEIKGIRNRIRGAKKGSLEERKLYAELERLKSSSENYTQTMLNIGTFVKNDQHNPIATGENLSLYNAIANNTVVRKIENGKLLVSETGEEGTFKDFNDLKKGMILKDHQNHNDLLKYAEGRQKEAKNNPKMTFDSQEGINYIETNNFKTREAFADIITTRVGNMKYSFLEAAYGKDRKVMDQIDSALAGVNTQNLVNKGLDKSGDGKISSADFTTKENKEAIIKAITDINDENFDFQVAKRVAAEFYNDGLVQPYYLRGVRNRATPRSRVDDKSKNIGVSYGNKYISRSAADAFFRDMTNKQKKIFSPNGKTYEFINGQYYITNLVNPETGDLLPPQPRSNMQILSAAELWNEGYRIDEFKGKTSDEDANNVLNNAYQKQQSSQVQGIYSDVYTDPNAVVNLFPNLNLEDQ